MKAFHRIMAGLWVELVPKLDHSQQSPWEIAAQWVVPQEVYPEAGKMGATMHAMATKKIIKADVNYKGTQLKALLILGGQKVVFKPKWYSRSYVVEEEPYAGYDRHNAEVAAIHLNRILGFHRAPLVVGRYAHLQTEIKPVAREQLLNTFLTVGNSMCFYGKCYYCRETEPACADGDMMEGSITLWLPDVWSLQKHRHPWGRTYREGKLSRWEYDESYCPHLLDIIDTAYIPHHCVFDYLIGNADHHHYESFQDDEDSSMLILLDNAKSFGNPSLNERSILASLYQCCIIQNGALKSALKSAMARDPISPVLSDPHLDTVNQRLLNVLATVKQCTDQFGIDTVLVQDRMLLSHL
uniref:FAM20 C-terminal domain-containing protein n=1 Tax=Cricetulus griseus TaxID=10029 RepID=A0A8C2LGV2_CRIGR